MTYRTTHDKVRDFELNREDAARLAACLNSFDDSDSWPGGFTRGNPFTADRVLEDWGKSNSMRVLVGYSGDKIVGHCNVADAELDVEAAYVGLLGVDPSFQGGGFGKALLIEAAQTAARAGKRRIDLHTWGGNLKAVPLYKRTGYNWVPGTRVLMESHIPGIIGAPLFKRFFERYDWYDSLKVDIKQEIDDIVEDDVGLFKYRFEGANGDRLLVTIDREAKGINGFDLTIDGERVAAGVRPDQHRSYIGLGQMDVVIDIENGLGRDLDYSIRPKPANLVQFEFADKDGSKGCMNTESNDAITGHIKIEPDADPLNREKNAWKKTSTQVEFVLTIDEEDISLFCGVIPTEPVQIVTGPLAPLLSPDQISPLNIGLTNHTESTIEGEARFVPLQEGTMNPQTHQINLRPMQSATFDVDVSAAGFPDPSVLSFDISVHIQEGGELKPVVSKTLNVPVIGPSGAVAYEGLGEYMWIETESFRMAVSKSPPMSVRSFEHKTMGLPFDGQGLIPDIGYPFADEGNEWDRKEFDVAIDNTTEYADIRMTAESMDRPGLHLSSTFRAHRGGGGLEQIVTLENKGTKPITNLGYLVRGWIGTGASRAYVPLRGEIRCLDSLDWSGGRQLPTGPENYHEHWIANVEQERRSVTGYIWDSRFLDRVRISRGSLPRIEYRFPSLEPGDSVTFSPIRMLITDGSWRKVRLLWRRIAGETAKPDLEDEVRPDVEFEIVPKGAQHQRWRPSPVFMDRADAQQSELRIRIIHENPIDAEAKITMPKGLLIDGKPEMTYAIKGVSIDNPVSIPLELSYNNSNGWLHEGGNIQIDFSSRNINEPFAVVVYDSSLEPEQSDSKVEKYTVCTTKAGDYHLVVSPEHRGGLVRFGKISCPSPLLDTFPKVKPFVWWDRFHSGITPFLVGHDTWDWESYFSKEAWAVEKIDAGPWTGYEASTQTKHVPNAKGILLQARYMILKGTPLVHVRVRITNVSDLWKRVMFGFRGAPRPGGDTRSVIHTKWDGNKMKYVPTGNNTNIFASTDDAWGALEGAETGEVLGVVSTIRTQPSLTLNVQSEDAQTIGVRKWVTLGPEESSEANAYLMLAESPGQVERLKGLHQRLAFQQE